MSISVNWNKIKTYAISILVPVLLGAAIALLTMGSIDYNTLIKPPLSPPSWLFPVAWSVLYVLMGISHGILKSKGLTTHDTETVYYVQLGVNLLWPVIFFIPEWRLFALVWIVALDILIIIMAVRFYRRDRAAGFLQIPYILWVLFATYLNLGIYLLNR